MTYNNEYSVTYGHTDIDSKIKAIQIKYYERVKEWVNERISYGKVHYHLYTICRLLGSW